MRIMICGSMTFAEQMLQLQQQLTAFSHQVNVPCDAEIHRQNSAFIDDLDVNREHLIENDIMRKCFELVAASEAVVFLNLPKNGVDGYIGTSSLIEMGLAYYLNKEIYLMYSYPDPTEHRWAHEVASFQPTVLNGNIDIFGQHDRR